jgi:hypothetical protein
LTFFKKEMGDPNPTQQDFIPVYLGMLEKGAQVYRQEKDERNVSFHQDTTSATSSSADEKQHKLLNKNCELKEEALPPLSGLEATVCERETPIHQDLRTTIVQPQKPGIMSPRRQNHVIGPIKCLNVKTLQTQVLEESHNPFASITSRSLRCSLVKPALVNDQSHASLEWRRRSPPPSSVITNVMCETEAPSRPDISSLATSTRHADSDWGQPKTPYTEQEAFKSSCIEYSFVKDFADLPDSPEDQRDSPDESDTHLTQETISSPELQKSNKASQVLDTGLACQDTCQKTNTKPVIADRRFDQLYIYIGEVSQDLAL